MVAKSAVQRQTEYQIRLHEAGKCVQCRKPMDIVDTEGVTWPWRHPACCWRRVAKAKKLLAMPLDKEGEGK